MFLSNNFRIRREEKIETFVPDCACDFMRAKPVVLALEAFDLSDKRVGVFRVGAKHRVFTHFRGEFLVLLLKMVAFALSCHK